MSWFVKKTRSNNQSGTTKSSDNNDNNNYNNNSSNNNCFNRNHKWPLKECWIVSAYWFRYIIFTLSLTVFELFVFLMGSGRLFDKEGPMNVW